jgi:hypothetical protein
MGNRGCLHDQHQRVVRRFKGKLWILCLLQFKGRKRAVMSPDRYTELFFLDEATGLAAGHRPCGECQRTRYVEFRDAWTRANPSYAGAGPVSASQMDAVLHQERLDSHREKRIHEADHADLPSGAMVVSNQSDRALLVLGGDLYPWSMSGYGAPAPRPARGLARVLTPPSIVAALAAGYAAEIHPSARRA